MNAESRARNLRRVLHPRHVCIVGGQAMAEAIRHCAAGGFAGTVSVINPHHAELGGRRCHAALGDLPEAPDVAYLAVPREATIGLLAELAAMGAGGAICYAAGFAEVGGEGVELQRRLVEAAGDLAVLGPNCYGLLNHLDGVALWPSSHPGSRVTRGAALIAQSGNIALNLALNERSVPFAYVISSGNQAVLGLADFIDALVDDARIDAIGLYIEGIGDVPAFARAAAKAAAAGKPIVALKAGKSELGGKLALSHTSSLAGSDQMYEALFERLGVMRVHSLPELLETLKLVAGAGLPRGERLAVFTCSGGDSLMTADLAEALGLPLPPPAPEQAAELARELPNFATVSNPLDYNTSLWGHADKLTECFSVMLRGDYDAGLLVIDYALDGEASRQACDASVDALIAACRRHGKMPLIASTLPELLPASARESMIARGAAPLQGLPEAMIAFALAARFAARRAAGAAAPLPPALPAVASGRRLLGEAAAKAALAAHGLPVPSGRVVAPAAAAETAAALGFPVAVKVAKPVLAHKTEAGAVVLNLGSGAEVERAVAAMARSLARHDPQARLEAVLVEKMIGGGLAELIVGVKRDPQFGLVLAIGAGGVLVELVEDAALLLLPASRGDIAAALSRLRIAKLLHGYRGREGADLEALVAAIAAIAAYAESQRATLVELDVNPLIALPTGALAADALIVLAEDDA